jgi:hypothetical protein
LFSIRVLLWSRAMVKLASTIFPLFTISTLESRQALNFKISFLPNLHLLAFLEKHIPSFHRELYHHFPIQGTFFKIYPFCLFIGHSIQYPFSPTSNYLP